MPRDIESSVGELVEAYLFNVDDLDRVVAANRALRVEEVGDAEHWSMRFLRIGNKKQMQRNASWQKGSGFFATTGR